MKNLILADLRVLGHRLWAVPLGVFLFIFSFSFIPYLDQVYKFQNWIFAILIPGLLTLELFREEQKSKADSMLLTMPVSKEKYVWSKYIITSVFILIGIIVANITDLLLETLNFYPDLSRSDFFSLGNIYISQITFMMFMLTIPAFYLTRNILLAIPAGIITFITTTFIFAIVDSRISIYFWRNRSDLLEPKVYMISGLIFIVTLAVIIFLEGNYLSKIYNILFAVFLFVFSVLFKNLVEQIDLFLIYSSRLKSFSATSIHRDYYYLYSHSFKSMAIILSTLIVLVVLILYYLIKKNKNKFVMSLTALMYLPVFFLVFLTITTLYTNYKSEILYITTAYTGLLIFFTASVSFSIYLLKNNRRLS